MNLPPRRKASKTLTERGGQWEYLAKSSPKDKPWDTHRSLADGVGEILTSPGTERRLWKQGKRMEECAPALMFALSAAVDTGEITFKLANAKFCRVRYCPVCQWRRSLMWKARFYEALPKIIEKQPTGQWIFLTLTQKNCLIGDLRDEIGEMNKAFHRLVKRKEFRGVAGWIRSLEITPGKNGPGQAHPHFHVLLLVKPSYFSHDYTTHAQWRQAWSEAMRLDYLPDVKVQKIRFKKAEVERLGSKDAALAAAVAETLKYSVKPEDMLHDPDWFLEMVRQTHRTRAIAAGGLLKNALRQEDESQQDLLLADEEKPPEPEAPTVRFDYAPEVSKYRRKRG
jgi:plasmid rolling circle replication initiator protein Rep